MLRQPRDSCMMPRLSHHYAREAKARETLKWQVAVPVIEKL